MINWLLRHPFIAFALILLVIAGGLATTPFNTHKSIPSSPVAVDALPNLGENQQIVFTEWPGRSPQDVDDQVSYPLSLALMGVPGVRDVRTLSMFGFSSIAVIFDENIDFYWSRSRLLEKLSALPADTLPAGVQPTLGPDATGLGQVYWYTLEGRDRHGKPIGGWSLDDVRSVQDWLVRYALLGVQGVTEVASVGGYVREYQTDVDANALRLYNLSLAEVLHAVANSNLDVGARTTEINQVEYLIRGIGFLESLTDIEQAVVAYRNEQTPIRVSDVATVGIGPATRAGALDVDGVEAVGGVVTIREGANALEVIEKVQEKITQLAVTLPRKAVIDWALVSPEQVELFAQQNQLPLWQPSEVNHMADSANESWRNWLGQHPEEQWPEWLAESQLTIVPFYDRSVLIEETLGTLSLTLYQQIFVTAIVILLLLARFRAAAAVVVMLPLTVLTTFIAMRLLHIEANIVAVAGIAIAIGTIVDMAIIMTDNVVRKRAAHPEWSTFEQVKQGCEEVAPAVVTAITTTVISFLPVFALTGAEGKLFSPLAYTKTLVLICSVLLALMVLPVLLQWLFNSRFERWSLYLNRFQRTKRVVFISLVVWLVWGLSKLWMPLGVDASVFKNLLFVALIFGLFGGTVWLLLHFYQRLLGLLLRYKALFMLVPLALVVVALILVPRLGREFMPALDEGTFLYMPTTMPHASIGEVLAVLSEKDSAIAAIPEVERVVGKLGRAETALDPAPVSMIETIIQYKPEFALDESGKRVRQWRDHIHSPDDIWQEIVAAGQVLGVTSAPKLQPIETRQIMLQTGMRASMGIKVQAPDLARLEQSVIALEGLVRESPMVNAGSVNGERVVGQPYLEIHLDRDQLARYGLTVAAVQETISTAIGGVEATKTVTGRERYSVRVRYQREQRDSIEAMEQVLLATPAGTHIPLSYVTTIEYVRGPQMIRSENTFLTAYVTFGARSGLADVDVVESVQALVADAINQGQLQLAEGVQYSFAGSYQHQQRASATLSWVLPAALLLIFTVLYLQFKRLSTALMVFSGIAVAWSGGFILLYLYGQTWFLNFTLPWLSDGATLQSIFQIKTIHLSIAVWVGFLALFGIAVDDGVIMATYLKQRFDGEVGSSVTAIRSAVIEAGSKRVRPCLITSATTIIALLPVITASGRGADIMIPMAIPTIGGLFCVGLSMFLVPILWSWREEQRLKQQQRIGSKDKHNGSKHEAISGY